MVMSGNNEYACDGEGANCCCKSRLQEVLSKYFSFSSFRHGQIKAPLSVLHGKDTFVRMATGSGKTLCMFLGPLAKSDNALGVIISPLNGLMEQQVSVLLCGCKLDCSGLIFTRSKVFKGLALLPFMLGLIVEPSMKQYPKESTGLVGLK